VSAHPLLKICGITRLDQALIIAGMGVDAIGVIGVPGSPRCLPAPLRQALFAAVAEAFPDCERVLVLADPADEDLRALESVDPKAPTVLQLHGSEPPECCRRAGSLLPGMAIWKAWRLRAPGELEALKGYGDAVDALLLDAWRPGELGGAGQRLPLDWLEECALQAPWWLAGGICADVVPEVLARVRPHGFDASSRLEQAPGDKDLDCVRRLLEAVRSTR